MSPSPDRGTQTQGSLTKTTRSTMERSHFFTLPFELRQQVFTYLTNLFGTQSVYSKLKIQRAPPVPNKQGNKFSIAMSVAGRDMAEINQLGALFSSDPRIPGEMLGVAGFDFLFTGLPEDLKLWRGVERDFVPSHSTSEPGVVPLVSTGPDIASRVRIHFLIWLVRNAPLVTFPDDQTGAPFMFWFHSSTTARSKVLVSYYDGDGIYRPYEDIPTASMLRDKSAVQQLKEEEALAFAMDEEYKVVSGYLSKKTRRMRGILAEYEVRFDLSATFDGGPDEETCQEESRIYFSIDLKWGQDDSEGQPRG